MKVIHIVNLMSAGSNKKFRIVSFVGFSESSFGQPLMNSSG